MLSNSASRAAPWGFKIQPEDKKIFVSVSNTGLTIPENELSRIFDRFHKTDKSRSVDRDGVGLWALYRKNHYLLPRGGHQCDQPQWADCLHVLPAGGRQLTAGQQQKRGIFV